MSASREEREHQKESPSHCKFVDCRVKLYSNQAVAGGGHRETTPINSAPIYFLPPLFKFHTMQQHKVVPSRLVHRFSVWLYTRLVTAPFSR